LPDGLNDFLIKLDHKYDLENEMYMSETCSRKVFRIIYILVSKDVILSTPTVMKDTFVNDK
jgi:hypothetical protein